MTTIITVLTEEASIAELEVGSEWGLCRLRKKNYRVDRIDWSPHTWRRVHEITYVEGIA